MNNFSKVIAVAAISVLVSNLSAQVFAPVVSAPLDQRVAAIEQQLVAMTSSAGGQVAGGSVDAGSMMMPQGAMPSMPAANPMPQAMPSVMPMAQVPIMPLSAPVNNAAPMMPVQMPMAPVAPMGQAPAAPQAML